MDIETGEFRSVAKTNYPSGLIDWLAITGDHVVYIDSESVPDTFGGDPLRWQLWAVNLRTGESELIDESGPAGSMEGIAQNADDERVVWVRWADPLDPRKGMRIEQWEPGTKPSVVAADLRISSATVYPSTHGVVYPSLSRGQVRGTSRQDLHLLGEDGVSTPLTSSGLLIDFTVNDDRLTWTEYSDPRSVAEPAAEPYKIFTRRLGDPKAESVQVQEGYSDGNAVAGESFVAWWPQGRGIEMAAVPASGGTEASVPDSVRLVMQRNVSARLDTDGDRLVFASTLGGNKTRIHVLTVRATRR
ncbi:hypothetical protein [Nocardioides limicola]|uniref:hypothetical protein n=1 Tax=Nocardioides limicola TaxID=2803368 RepID=UPI00193B66FA|nr:hypothetical protein [Nocardioides sp. DJM-14]